MSTEHRKRRQVWVGDFLCTTMSEAAEVAGIPLTAVFRLLRQGGGEAGGVRIAETAPQRERTVLATGRGGPLLRYPVMEGPLDRGIPERWR